MDMCAMFKATSIPALEALKCFKHKLRGNQSINQ